MLLCGHSDLSRWPLVSNCTRDGVKYIGLIRDKQSVAHMFLCELQESYMERIFVPLEDRSLNLEVL